ncbi:probable protein phosphatase 2C 11 [Tanacetum coccineum]
MRPWASLRLSECIIDTQEVGINGVEFIIVASDGLWNVLSNKDAVGIVQEITDAEAACRKLVQESYTRGSSHNITCIVVQVFFAAKLDQLKVAETIKMCRKVIGARAKKSANVLNKKMSSPSRQNHSRSSDPFKSVLFQPGSMAFFEPPPL